MNIRTLAEFTLHGMVVLLLFCAGDRGTNEQHASGSTAIIYHPDGKTAAAGALVKLFDVAAAGSNPTAIRVTDANGRWSIDDLPPGIYGIWAEKDSLVLFQDSGAIKAAGTVLDNETLEFPSSVSGIVRVEPYHDPRTVTIQVAGINKYVHVADTGGAFTLSGLAAGTWSLALTSTLPGYAPALETITIAAGSHTAIADTLRLAYTGMPLVSGIRISQDTLAGMIMLAWDASRCSKFRDYLIYRDDCMNSHLSTTPCHATVTTFFVDSIYCAMAADPLDTATHCLRYRIAVRDSMNAIGPTFRFSELPFASKASVVTFFNHAVRHARRGCDSASINDTVEIVLTARNMTRSLRSCAYYYSGGSAVAQRISSDVGRKEITDTLRCTFDSVGTNRILAVVIDNAGVRWTDTVPVRIVRDAPLVHAGNDTEVFPGDTVRLHGTASQQFGAVTSWEWKIGPGSWTPAALPDTIIRAPASQRVWPCSLAAIDDDGNRSTAGINVFTTLHVRAVSAGLRHSLIIKADSTLWTFGSNEYGQGSDKSTKERLVPMFAASQTIKCAAGDNHSLILKSYGELWACGDNSSGQLGDSTNTRRYIPVRIFDNVLSIAGGGYHTLIRTNDGTLRACGKYDGNGSTSPLPLAMMPDVQGMVAGENHTLALKTDGTLWAYGENSYGQLGNGTTLTRSAPIQIMDEVIGIAAGGYHSLILKSDNSLWACGKNDFGQLCDATNISRISPVRVMTGVQSAFAGKFHSLILKTDNSLWACGRNDFGQLGDGTTINRTSPVQVTAGVQSAAAGGFHSLILKADGSVWVCGNNDHGQLGDGTNVNRCLPVRIVPCSKPKEGFFQ